jgi:hypothetical protein
MADVPAAVVTSIESHGQFLTTLALATSGAVFAFLIQIVFHNSQSNHTPIRIRRPGLLMGGIILNFLSIACWYVLKSSLVAAIPALYGIQWCAKSTTAILRENDFGLIPWLSSIQIFFFSAGLLVLLIALFVNLPLIRGETER